MEKRANEVIYKYPLLVKNVQSLELSEKCTYLCVNVIDNKIFFWCKEDITSRAKTYKLYMYGTGNFHSEIKGTYLGTVVLRNGTFVNHIFISD